MSHPRPVEGEVRVFGQRWSLRVHQLKDFLVRSRVKTRWFDVERDSDAKAVVQRAGGNVATNA